MKAPGEELQRNLESIQVFKQFFPFLYFFWAIVLFLNPDPVSDSGLGFRDRIRDQNPDTNPLAQ
jgi:hypothetical protein